MFLPVPTNRQPTIAAHSLAFGDRDSSLGPLRDRAAEAALAFDPMLPRLGRPTDLAFVVPVRGIQSGPVPATNLEVFVIVGKRFLLIRKNSLRSKPSCL